MQSPQSANQIRISNAFKMVKRRKWTNFGATKSKSNRNQPQRQRDSQGKEEEEVGAAMVEKR